MLKSLIVPAIIMAATPMVAGPFDKIPEGWYLVASSNDGDKYYLNAKSLRYDEEGGFLRFEIMNVNPKTVIFDIIAIRKGWDEIAKLQSLSFRKTDGKQIDSWRASRIEWNYINDRTVACEIRNFIKAIIEELVRQSDTKGKA